MYIVPLSSDPCWNSDVQFNELAEIIRLISFTDTLLKISYYSTSILSKVLSLNVKLNI